MPESPASGGEIPPSGIGPMHGRVNGMPSQSPSSHRNVVHCRVLLGRHMSSQNSGAHIAPSVNTCASFDALGCRPWDARTPLALKRGGEHQPRPGVRAEVDPIVARVSAHVGWRTLALSSAANAAAGSFVTRGSGNARVAGALTDSVRAPLGTVAIGPVRAVRLVVDEHASGHGA